MVTSADWELHQAGDGRPAVLFLHGWGGDRNSLWCLAEPVSRHRLTVAPSLPGFGRTPEPAAAWGTFDYADGVAALVETCDLGPVDIVAHSFGGRVALALAARRPELVRRMVLVASAGLRRKRRWKAKMKIAASVLLGWAAHTSPPVLQKRFASVREKLGSPDWRAASQRMRQVLVRMVNEDLSALCSSVTAPTLLIWGDCDTETPLEMGRRLAKALPQSELIVIPGAGHFPFLERRGEVLAALWKHLELPSAWD